MVMSDPTDAPVPASTPATPVQPAVPVVLPAENRTRGTLLALLIIPAGIIVWSVIASIGFISGWIAIGIAIGALALYRFGSGGRVSYNGALRVSVITVVTIVLAYISGFVVPNGAYFARALRSGKFFEGLDATMARGGGDTLIGLLLVLAFTVLGVVIVFRTAATQKKEQAAAEAAAGHTAI